MVHSFTSNGHSPTLWCPIVFPSVQKTLEFVNFQGTSQVCGFLHGHRLMCSTLRLYVLSVQSGGSCIHATTCSKSVSLADSLSNRAHSTTSFTFAILPSLKHFTVICVPLW